MPIENILKPEHYRQLVDSANSIILLWAADGTIMYMNKFGLEFFGFTDEELIGANVIGTIVPENSMSGADLKAMIRNITANTEQYAVNDNENRRKNGEMVWVSWSNKPVIDNGKMAGILSIGNDVTEKMQLQVQLHESKQNLEKMVRERTGELELSEAKYRALADNAVIGIAMVVRNEWTYANKALLNMLGMKEEELFRLPIPDLIAPEEREKVLERYNKRLQGNPSSENQYESVILKKDGTRINVFMTVGSFMEEEHRAVIATFEDITEEKKAAQLEKHRQEELFQASKMVALGTLVAGVAHEINNPNNFIMLNTPILYDSWNDAKKILDSYLEEKGDFTMAGMPYSEMREAIPRLFSGIRDGSERIKNIVSGLKDFARKDSSSLDAWVNINDVVKSALLLLGNKIKKSCADFSVKYEEGLPSVKGNFQRLEQVVLNVIQNALEAVKVPGKKVTVETYSTWGVVYLKVTDEGVGMDAETLKHISDPFFTTKRSEGGTGLGMSISMGIVNDHRGELNYRSEPGKGTEALLMLAAVRGGVNA